jgi:hypothetical protein
MPPGSIPRPTVIDVLIKNDVSVAVKGSDFVLSKGDILEVHKLPDPLHRRMIGRLANRFGIPVHKFYHPDTVGSA